ncbi:hypothetical protein [Sphingobacterium sp. 1.A.4]|uniref:hypothetical protein n=1 Tax=Sphingobacterium sp. 1.A.4 TaxID=2044603 RepID=UPI000C0C0E3A|nr:hypothetical protein [Sphingobacterium sp. 1.A.4]
MTTEKTYYQIGGLVMEISSPSLFPIQEFLTSFEDFQVDEPKDKASCSVEISFDYRAVELELGVGSKSLTGKLLTESIIWGDDFRFYEMGNSYLASIYIKDQNHYWYMQCSKDFRQAKIFMQ